MPRNRCRRRIGWWPVCWRFSAEGGGGDVVRLTLAELEAIRLADLEGLYQEEAARRMGVSRATFGRILEEGRRKVAEALIKGKGIQVVPDGTEAVEHLGWRCHRWRHRFRGGMPQDD